MSRIERVYDLPKVSQTERITESNRYLENGETFTEMVNNPKGSPNNPSYIRGYTLKSDLTFRDKTNR